ncbi:MAG: FtsX-like permease family protein, partial [Acidobacteriota bacterium]
MRVPTFFALLRRDLRGSRGHLLFFVLSLAVGVGAVVAVASLSAAIDQGVRREARQLLAADLAIVGRQPIPDAMLEAVDGLPGAERVDLREMFTVVALPDDEPQRAPAQVGTTLRSLLVELKSVGVGYPFYGELELEPAGPLRLDAQSVAAEPELLRRLGLTLGDQLRVGGEEFRIVARVLREPDRLTGAFQMGPRLLISTEGLARADLERFGSRVEHRTLIRLPDASPGELTAAVETLEAARPEGEPHRVETWREAQPALRAGLQRSENFLGLAALLSLLIGGIGVAQTVRSWIAGRLNAIAVLTSLGMRRREILSLYLGQTALLGLAASALGVLAGVALVAVARGVLGGSLPVETIDPIQPEVWDRGLALGTGIAVLFALPALSVATRVPPVRVLRRSAEPLGLSPGAQGAFEVLAVLRDRRQVGRGAA